MVEWIHGKSITIQRRGLCHPIYYKGKAIEKTYEPDLWCFGKIIVELKAVGALAEEHRRQILNYLRITKCRLGLLVNFGAFPKVAIERYAL